VAALGPDLSHVPALVALVGGEFLGCSSSCLCRCVAVHAIRRGVAAQVPVTATYETEYKDVLQFLTTEDRVKVAVEACIGTTQPPVTYHAHTRIAHLRL